MAGRNRSYDTGNMKTESARSVDLPASSFIDTSETYEELASQLEIVDHLDKNELEMTAFMEEEVKIIVLPSDSDYAEEVVHLCHNGRNQFILRGIAIIVKRKFVDILARSKLEFVQTPEAVDSQGHKTNSIKVRTNLKYPFTVISDRNPIGSEWLQNTIAEAA